MTATRHPVGDGLWFVCASPTSPSSRLELSQRGFSLSEMRVFRCPVAGSFPIVQLILLGVFGRRCCLLSLVSPEAQDAPTKVAREPQNAIACLNMAGNYTCQCYKQDLRVLVNEIFQKSFFHPSQTCEPSSPTRPHLIPWHKSCAMILFALCADRTAQRIVVAVHHCACVSLPRGVSTSCRLR